MEDTPETIGTVLTRRRDLAEHRLSELAGMLVGRALARLPDTGLSHLAHWIESHEAVWECNGVAELREALAPALDSRLRTEQREAVERAIRRIGPHVRKQAQAFARVPDVRADPGPHCLKGRVVFTGIFVSIERSQVEALTKALGALVRSNVAYCTNVLVVGGRCHPAWKHARYGRKIEKVLRWRQDGRTQCKIADEASWCKTIVEEAERQKNPPQ